MLVGAGEIDAALLVVAADDGPRAQTLEHLALLDALGIDDGVAVVTKTDVVEPRADGRGRGGGRAAARRARSLAGSPVLAVSAVSGEGLEALRAALAGLARTGRGRAATASARGVAPGDRPGLRGQGSRASS